MNLFFRRLVLTLLSFVPVTSIAFAAQKALKTGELKGYDDVMERSGGPSIM